MQEVTAGAKPASARLDLSKVPEQIHDYLLELTAKMKPAEASKMIEAASRVDANADGSIVVLLARTYSVGTPTRDVDRIRLRAIKARDYIDGTTRSLVESHGLGESVAFGASLSNDAEAVDEFMLDDMNSLYFGVRVLRKNWWSPKS